MYSHCIFCKSHLGGNTSLERFPVGGKLAFDEKQGRLWVVCQRCARWNLSPLEERWEVIEECERLFSGAVRRMSTEHIGLSVLRSGLQLVRIGTPKRPEMAAWRYGAEFLRRRRRHRGAQLITFGAAVLGWGPLLAGRFAYRSYVKRKAITSAIQPDGAVTVLRGRDARSMHLEADADSLILRLGNPQRPRSMFEGKEAFRAAGLLLPWINTVGTNSAGVERAVRQIERFGTGVEFFRSAVPRMYERTGALRPGSGFVRRAPAELRLALEMAAHEDLEQQSLRGELAELEAAWREADEIARIADGLLMPARIERLIERMRGAGTTTTRSHGG